MKFSLDEIRDWGEFEDLATVNIPSLIHMYNADGYLLVCKNRLTSTLTTMFEQLNEKCSFNYQYKFWDGNFFRSKLLLQTDLHQKFFPQYYEYWNNKNLRLD